MTTKIFKVTEKPLKTIPYTNGWSITPEGTLLTPSNKVVDTFTIRVNKLNEKYVGVPIGDVTVVIRLGILVCIVYKNSSIPAEHWPYLDLYYKDGDVTNLHPSNITFKPYPDTLVSVYDGVSYKTIPNYTRYGISRSGDIRRLKDGRPMKLHPNDKGYIKANLYSDIQGRSTTASRHRLLMMTYKGYPINVDNLDVNHENGIPGSDDLSNLEWETRRGNVLHAINTGLHSRARPIYAYDIFTGEVTKFPSIERINDVFGTRPSKIVKELQKAEISPIRKPHHKYSYSADIVLGEVIPTKVEIIQFGKLEVYNRKGRLVKVCNFLKDLVNTSYTKLGRTGLYHKFNNSGGEHVIEGHSLLYRFGPYCYDGLNVFKK